MAQRPLWIAGTVSKRSKNQRFARCLGGFETLLKRSNVGLVAVHRCETRCKRGSTRLARLARCSLRRRSLASYLYRTTHVGVRAREKIDVFRTGETACLGDSPLGEAPTRCNWRLLCGRIAPRRRSGILPSRSDDSFLQFPFPRHCVAALAQIVQDVDFILPRLERRFEHRRAFAEYPHDFELVHAPCRLVGARQEVDPIAVRGQRSALGLPVTPNEPHQAAESRGRKQRDSWAIRDNLERDRSYLTSRHGLDLAHDCAARK